ncbi:hypothetical protein [Marinobacterium sediminicola]|nr:hypothetical protein [Marinobacterium sediminicola]ULG68125.1 hypothetical protein LN244_10435 [Marinobacterium sediminicola]
MNAQVSILNTNEQRALENVVAPNRIPVKVDVAGRVWLEGKLLTCPPRFPCCSRGELVFSPCDVTLLLGPWGPDPDNYLTLSGCYSAQSGDSVTLVLDSGLKIRASLPGGIRCSSTLKPLQKVWLAIPLAKLQFCQ